MAFTNFVTVFGFTVTEAELPFGDWGGGGTCLGPGAAILCVAMV